MNPVKPILGIAGPRDLARTIAADRGLPVYEVDTPLRSILAELDPVIEPGTSRTMREALSGSSWEGLESDHAWPYVQAMLARLSHALRHLLGVQSLLGPMHEAIERSYGMTVIGLTNETEASVVLAYGGYVIHVGDGPCPFPTRWLTQPRKAVPS